VGKGKERLATVEGRKGEKKTHEDLLDVRLRVACKVAVELVETMEEEGKEVNFEDRKE
jgi:hypothetical protein